LPTPKPWLVLNFMLLNLLLIFTKFANSLSRNVFRHPFVDAPHA
jgi:hypothetical protein